MLKARIRSPTAESPHYRGLPKSLLTGYTAIASLTRAIIPYISPLEKGGRKMASLLVKRQFALRGIIAEPVYYCNGVRIIFRYANGVKTDEVQGHKYLVTNTDTYEQIEVFVAGTKPLFSPEELEAIQESGERVFVEFENAVVKPYYSERTHSIEDSIKADRVKIVKTEN